MLQPSASHEPLQQFTWQGKTTSISIDESTLCLRNSSKTDSKELEIPSCHILSASPVEPSKKNASKWTLKVDYIKSTGEMSLKTSTTLLQGSKENCQSAASDINTLVKSLPNRKKSLLVIVNPVSGRKKGLKTCQKILPFFELANIKTEVIVTKEKGHASKLLKEKDLSDIDGIVLVGGDGTYYEVLNGLLYRAQVDAKYDLDIPGCDWMPSPLPVGNSGKFLTFGGLLVGYGFFSDIIYKSENRRTLGIFRYPVYLLWGLFNLRRFKVCIEYEVPKDNLTEPSEGGASTVIKGGGDCSVIKGGGDSSVQQKEGGTPIERKEDKDCASDVNFGSKPENISVTSPHKEPVRRKVIAEINRNNDGESNLEVKGQNDAEDQNRKLSDGESKTGDNEAAQSVGAGDCPNGSVTDGAVPNNIPKGPVATVEFDVADNTNGVAATAVSGVDRKDWKCITGTYISFGTILHLFELTETEAVEVILCNTVGDLKDVFRNLVNPNNGPVGTTFKTRRLLLEVPVVNQDNEMEMALNCDGDYIILETPIAIQICIQSGLMNVFCC
ncbi:sphingosine kinase A-like [Octopus vulgaris]|uniref:Sphingosine kinase A-like n=1 Tax=Octopus vulgaris TaxID=6645 RepID=A0AA36BYV6_OCTVU|nr:sphingosine kinase A-like [Octopus vulgaris]